MGLDSSNEGEEMNCWHCQTELIWGGDHDCEDSVEWLIVSNLHCPNCQSHVDVYFPREEEEEEEDGTQ